MRVSKVSLSLRSSTRSGERRRGSVTLSHCHDVVVIGSSQSGGGAEEPWSRCVWTWSWQLVITMCGGGGEDGGGVFRTDCHDEVVAHGHHQGGGGAESGGGVASHCHTVTTWS